MKFLLLHYVDESAEWSAEETREDQALLASWLEDTIARGVNLQGSYLQPSQNAATIRARDSEILLTDGPFAETKEQIAGFDIIECADMREAIEVASAHPTTRHGTIEIRPFPPDLPAASPFPLSLQPYPGLNGCGVLPHLGGTM